MPILTELELRVLGALVEKQISTPDYYPLTLNGLVNACNQKNHRDPVTTYAEADVARALDSLRFKQLAFQFEGGTARVPKFGHTFPKTYNLEAPETAILCVLMLRGPQTPGELRSRTAHLHNFDSLPAVEETINKLSTRPEPLITKLPRTPGTKEARYAHLLGGEIKIVESSSSAPSEPTSSLQPLALSHVEGDRLTKLEAEVAELRKELDELKAKAN